MTESEAVARAEATQVNRRALRSKGRCKTTEEIAEACEEGIRKARSDLCLLLEGMRAEQANDGGLKEDRRDEVLVVHWELAAWVMCAVVGEGPKMARDAMGMFNQAEKVLPRESMLGHPLAGSGELGVPRRRGSGWLRGWRRRV